MHKETNEHLFRELDCSMAEQRKSQTMLAAESAVNNASVGLKSLLDYTLGGEAPDDQLSMSLQKQMVVASPDPKSAGILAHKVEVATVGQNENMNRTSNFGDGIQ